MKHSLWTRCTLLCVAIALVTLAGCPGPIDESEDGGQATDSSTARQADQKTATSAPKRAPSRISTAGVEDVDAAKKLCDALGSGASCKIVPQGVLVEIAIEDGSTLTAENIALFGRLSDLESLQIKNYRDLSNEMVEQLMVLENLKTLALTNSVLGDPAVELIVKSLPNLTALDLSSNPNMTNRVLKTICQLSNLERLSLVQNNFSDLGTSHLAKLEKLKVLDLRGNMQAGNMTLGVVGKLPAIVVFKHRSSTVGDYGIEGLAESKTLKSALMQDFESMTSDAGQYLAKMESLRELEIFRCQGFGSDGVLALKGTKLTRLQLRDLPMVDDMAMAVFEDLPELQRLYLHENDSISDEGLKSLANLKSLEVLDIWTVSQMGDATVDVIATLPKLRELSIRTTGVTDAAVDKILAMSNLESLVFKENGSVSDEAIKKLTTREWTKLDIGQ